MALRLKEVHRAGDNAGVRPIPVSSAVGYDVHEFLAWEAFLLDHRRYGEWAALLSRDLRYRGPAELFPEPDEPHPTSADMRPVRDYDFVLARVRELEGRLASEHTPVNSVSVHRLITNVMVSPADCSREFAVTSYVLVTGMRADEREERILTVERRDCLRRMSDSFQITRRDLRITGVPQDMRQWVKFL